MLGRFPQEAVLRDGKRVMIRLFKSSDAEALYQFYQNLPPEVRRFTWDRVEDRPLIDSWARHIDYSRVLPFIALDGTRIVADATLHRHTGGPLRLVGRFKWFFDPEYRGLGLGTTLVNDAITMARDQGLRHLTCMLISDIEQDAIKTLTSLGFDSWTFPAYGTDPDGNQHDMTKLVLKL